MEVDMILFTEFLEFQSITLLFMPFDIFWL